MFTLIKGGYDPSMDAEAASVLASWGAWQRVANLSPRTIAQQHGIILRLLRHAGCGPLELTPGDIMGFLAADGVCRSSRATYHAAIRAYHRWLIRAGLRPDDPTLATPVPKRAKGTPHPIQDTALVRMLDVTARQRARAMILLAAFEGLRVHEIAKVRGEDLDFGGGALYVEGKGGKTAVLPLHQLVADLAPSFPGEGYWFPSYEKPGEPIGPRAVSKAIKGVMIRAGVNGKPHHLRHWYGTTLVRNGVDLRTVQELMRHESLATTQIYTEVSDQQRRRGIDTLSLIA